MPISLLSPFCLAADVASNTDRDKAVEIDTQLRICECCTAGWFGLAS